jgi:hypothetical protein
MSHNELRILQLENRISQLSNNPVENANLIRKAKRELRNLENK